MKKTLVWYAVLLLLFGLAIWFVVEQGSGLIPHSVSAVESAAVVKSQPVLINSNETVVEQFVHNIKSPLGLFLLQIIVILLTSKVFGLVLTKIGQPSVVGEIIAGIFLGPSVIGLIFPQFSTFLFPADSLKNLQFLSQIGLALFMFIVGMELDIHQLKNKTHKAVVISHASILLPFFLGVSLTYFIYQDFAPAGVSFLAFALFMGIAMSITAFPVLARIVQERGLTKTPLGAMVITCAAADDVTAWCILACVIAVVKAGSIISALFTIALAMGFVVLMLRLVRPWLKKMIAKFPDDKALNKTTVAIMFLILLLSAYIAEIIGIHALFGAFIAGVVMPHNLSFKSQLTEKIEDISVLLLLPIFFAFTGLRTHIDLLNERHLWATCGFIIAVAVLGKFGGSAIAARFTGHSLRDSFSIGALMNTRGLMELIVLNIGYDLGILSPEIFAMMVLMALATTFMTGPLLDGITYFYTKRDDRKIALARAAETAVE